jgi:predicted ATPase with chaperone activity
MQFIRSSTLLAATILSAVSLVSVPAANAQTSAPSAQTPSTNIPDQKLDATASALQRVTDVRRTYEEKLSGAAAADEQKRIVSEANDAMSKAVTEQGLSLEEFDSIIRLAQSDVGVREKILQRVKPKE